MKICVHTYPYMHVRNKNKPQKHSSVIMKGLSLHEWIIRRKHSKYFIIFSYILT